MCGIFGIYSKKFEKNKLSKISIASLEMINHRGPDEKNIITYKNFSAGVKRLSIESIKFGKQPIENERYILGFNGELFNYKNLIKKYNFNKKDVRSEIQLILNLWMLKKEKFVNEIKGQYAIFIYDKKKEEIYLFRDPFGIRPVYFYLGKNHNDMFHNHDFQQF